MEEKIRTKVKAMMEEQWQDAGYTSPSVTTYPWQWLWDSCFHSLIWAKLGDTDKAVLELETLMNTMQPSGFIPHMNYVNKPEAAMTLWKQPRFSTITQPPMFGHAIAELIRQGISISDECIDKAFRALEFFNTYRIHEPSGLVTLCHPWESGADNNPRWDGYYELPHGHQDWQAEKVAMLNTIERDVNGTPLYNPKFNPAVPSFTALVAFNLLELEEPTGMSDNTTATSLIEAVENAWDDTLQTWVDIGPDNVDATAGVLDALLCILVDRNSDRVDIVVETILDPTRYNGRYGTTVVDMQHPEYDANGYWRGACWPQMEYLLWVALKRNGRDEIADLVAKKFVLGAATSNLSEYWNPDTGTGVGAENQSWTGLCLIPD